MTEDDIVAVLRAYRVQKHHRGTSAAKVPRYAVFCGRDQVTEPMPHDAAKAACEELIARDIIAHV